MGHPTTPHTNAPRTCISARLLFHSCVRPSASRRSTTATRQPRRARASAGSRPSVPPHTTASNGWSASAAAALLLVLLLLLLLLLPKRGVASEVTTARPLAWGSCCCWRSACEFEHGR